MRDINFSEATSLSQKVNFLVEFMGYDEASTIDHIAFYGLFLETYSHDPQEVNYASIRRLLRRSVERMAKKQGQPTTGRR